MDTDPLLLVHTTCADPEAAEALARELVDARLAACASIGAPVVSIYPWEGRIEREREVPLTLKTRRSAFERLRRHLVESHTYDVPELLATPVVESHDEYADWVREWVAGGEAGQ